MGEIDAKIIKRTQDTLGKIIKKPPLTEKLLSRPPFRFLHDICTSVIKTTGFMTGLFTEAEMQSDNIKDKDAKVAFLQKLIDLVSLVSGSSLSVRPTSIVGGKEAEKTNELLQVLAEAINKNVDNTEYVNRVLSGDNKNDDKHMSNGRDKHSADKVKDVKSEKDKEERHHRDRGDKEKDKESRSKRDKDRESGGGDQKDKERDRDRDSRHKDKERDREREKDKSRDKDKERENDEEKSRERKKEGDKDRDSRRKEKERDDRKEKSKEKTKVSDKPPAPESSNAHETNGSSEDPTPTRLQRPSSAKGHRVRKDGRRGGSSDEEDASGHKSGSVVNESGDKNRSLVRPPSARPAPPKPKRRGDMPAEEQQRLTSAGTGGRVSGVIIEREQDSDDDQFVVEETVGGGDLSSGQGLGQRQEEDEKGEGAEAHGGLVSKILATKKEYEISGANKQGKTEIEANTNVSDAARKRDRVAVEKEVERLRQSLQTLTRCANPLGKVMDFIQEDVDAMHKELERWRQENKQLAMELKREQNITDSAVEPLTAQLTEIELNIREQLESIGVVKSKILQNEDKMTKMLTTIVGHT